MKPRARLLTGVLAAVIAGGVGVALGVALLLGNTVHLRSSATATLRTGAYLDATIEVERLVIDAETGLRGYVITEHPVFLAPLRTAVSQMPSATAALERAAVHEHAYVARAMSLSAAARSYLLTYVPQVRGEVTRDPAAARSVATTLKGKQLVDQIRAQTASLERLISTRQAARQRSARSSANSAVAVAIVVLIVLTALTIALGGVLGWLLLTRERALERARSLYRRSKQTTRTLQESLLPATIPDIPSCQLAVRFVPAGEGDLVGGDFYDVFAVGNDHWALVLGDVCGKGATAAAVTGMARWTIRSFAGAPRPPAQLLRALNEALLRQQLDSRFITIVYALVRVEAEQAHITLACAGHPPAILVSDAGEPSILSARGDLLGVWSAIRLDQVELRLDPGESLLLYTDGVSDRGPGAESSPQQALHTLPATASAGQLADTLAREAVRGAGARSDDVAIVALRFIPQPRPLEADRDAVLTDAREPAYGSCVTRRLTRRT
jgi:phosphoserine phosphatase RsbU/P